MYGNRNMRLISTTWTTTYLFFNFTIGGTNKCVLEGQPWYFDRHITLLSEVKGNCKPSDVQIYTFLIWARLYNLLFKGRLNIVDVKAIGDKIRTFVKMDSSGSMGIDKFLRIRTLFCEKVGHGTKDFWLKTPPWKSCAKALFVTKPKGSKPAIQKEKVNEVMERLNNWVIHDYRDERTKDKKEGEGLLKEIEAEKGSNSLQTLNPNPWLYRLIKIMKRTMQTKCPQATKK
ncbi:Olfactory receptor 8S1 [Bienertia sinuspersici]